MIRKLKSGKYRIYSRAVDSKTHKRRNLGTFDSMEDAKNTKERFNISSTIDRPHPSHGKH
jgi:hypothetical protein